VQDFLEHSDLGGGATWTAEYKSWDWAHHGNFYFVITIYQDGQVVKQIKAAIDDYAYGDPGCRYSDADVIKMVKSDLHWLASRGESNTDTV